MPIRAPPTRLGSAQALNACSTFTIPPAWERDGGAPWLYAATVQRWLRTWPGCECGLRQAGLSPSQAMRAIKGSTRRRKRKSKRGLLFSGHATRSGSNDSTPQRSRPSSLRQDRLNMPYKFASRGSVRSEKTYSAFLQTECAALLRKLDFGALDTPGPWADAWDRIVAVVAAAAAARDHTECVT